MRWAWEAFKQDREDEAREEGRLIGIRESILDILGDLGEIPETLKDSIVSETKIDILKSMMKIANKATSFSDFDEKISKL